jgi:hypothetical protein
VVMTRRGLLAVIVFLAARGEFNDALHRSNLFLSRDIFTLLIKYFPKGKVG